MFEDFNNDGKPDLFVGNGPNPNYLYRNRGDGTFEEVGVTAGAAFSADGKEMSSMGIAVADYDRDGWMDVFVTTVADDNYILFHNDGDGLFTDVSYPSGVGEPTVPYLGWAAFFLDFDNDGWPDLLCANGHVYPEVDGRINETYHQPLQLLRNQSGGKFAEVKSLAGLPRQSSRGGAYADFDNDGDVDFAISTMDGKPMVIENLGGNREAWLSVRLEGTRSNRMGVGARVKVTPVEGGAPQFQTLRAGEGYLSSNDPRLHFGLGASGGAVRVEVKWPSGVIQTIDSDSVRRELVIREPVR